MSYYTERNSMRKPIEKTYTISTEMYALLFDCCERYFDNLAWKYPRQCPDGNGICGLDIPKLMDDLKFETPNLFGLDMYISPHWLSRPQKEGVFRGEGDDYDQFALLDFIEFVVKNLKDIKRQTFQSYYSHNDLTFENSKEILAEFSLDINAAFEKTGLQYRLNAFGEIERIVENSVLSAIIENEIVQVKEIGLKELLQEAITKFRMPRPADHKDAVEKIWDAFERLKTYYKSVDKKASAEKIVNNITNGNQDFAKLFTDEFRTLTDIGNTYRIRHHETNKIDITDDRYYDYFFNRCLSLISITLQYLY